MESKSVFFDSLSVLFEVKGPSGDERRPAAAVRKETKVQRQLETQLEQVRATRSLVRGATFNQGSRVILSR